MTILHISDSHYEWETMQRLDRLARRCDCDVIAVTGDVLSKQNRKLPVEWNEWPQRLKLAVPGNHDDAQAYADLTEWQTRTPWSGLFLNVMFVSCGFSGDALRPVFWDDEGIKSAAADAKALVLLVHYRPSLATIDCCRQNSREVPLLILHGHEHPKGSSATEWEEMGDGVYRSRVCSSGPYRPDGTADKGVAQKIEFGRDGVFRAQRVQG